MSTDTDRPVAAQRTVIAAPPGIGDENTGVIVAAGDELRGAGYIGNNPNRVDAAANYEEADAADKAGAGARPATRVVSQGEGPSQETLDRVAEGRNAWEEESRMLGAQAQEQTSPPPADFDPATATGKELDARYGSVEGYDKRAKVADRQAWAAEYERGR